MKKLKEDEATIKLNFCLPVSLHQKLKEEATENMVSMASVVRHLLKNKYS
jgi:hypothetical protein